MTKRKLHNGLWYEELEARGAVRKVSSVNVRRQVSACIHADIGFDNDLEYQARRQVRSELKDEA